MEERPHCPGCDRVMSSTVKWTSCGKCKGTFCTECVKEIMVTQSLMDLTVLRCKSCTEQYQPCDGCKFLSCDLEAETDHDGDGEEFVTGSYCERCRIDFKVRDEATKKAFYHQVHTPMPQAGEVFGPSEEVA